MSSRDKASATWRQLALAGSLTDLDRAIATFEQEEQSTPSHHSSRAEALTTLGIALATRFERVGRTGDLSRAIDAHVQALAVFRELGDRNSEGQALNNLALALRQARRFEEAIDAHVQALAVFRELGDRNSEGQALNNLGTMLSEVGRRQEALETAAEAVEIRRRLAADNAAAYEPDLAMSLNNLGTMLSEVGRRQEALETAAEAVEIRRRL
ncbi:tetratricopeptide repeat protein, partial [Streptomyces sp. NPDC056160]|uniref:tetratricopeptide repeat protein n=1 Tax=Streptomyces sp. NPDC056160 TaxID=3345731 RepID=UPI0035E16E29